MYRLPSRKAFLADVATAWGPWHETYPENQVGMQLTVVAGAAGTGRTEVLRDCYELCARGQDYWPATLPVSPNEVSQPLAPDPFEAPAEVGIPYLWLAMTGWADTFPILDAARQINDHISPILDAVLATDTVARDRLFAALERDLLVAPLAPLARPLAESISTLLRPSRPGHRLDRSEIAKALRPDAGQTIHPRQRAATRQLAINEAFSWARVGALVPLVIAVDDAHLLDPITVDFLSTLLRHGTRGLMILSVDTDFQPIDGTAGPNPALAGWLEEESANTHGIALNLGRTPDSELTELALDRLSTAIASVQPNESGPSDEQVKAGGPVQRSALDEVVRASAGLPGRLTTLVADTEVRHALTHPGAVLPDLDSITRRRILDQRWSELPATTRDLLARLALCGARVPIAFLPASVDPPELYQAMALGWLRSKYIVFGSRDLWQTAYDHVQDELSDDQEEAILNELSNHVTTVRHDGSWAAYDLRGAEDVLAALIRGNGSDNEQLAAADLMRLRRATGRQAASLSVLDAIYGATVGLDTSRFGSGVEAPLIRAAIDGYYDVGEDRRAGELLQQRHTTCEHESGPGGVEAIAAANDALLHWAAIVERDQGHPGRQEREHHVTSLSETLLRTLEEGRVDDQRVPDTRIRLANSYSRGNRPQDAAAQLELAIDEYSDLFSPYDPRTLALRDQLAVAYLDAGTPDRALQLLGETFVIRERAFGISHPDTLDTANSIGYVYCETGDSGKSIQVHQETLSDRNWALGPFHPDTLNSQNNLGLAYYVSGDLERAIPLFRDTLTAREWFLGPDHVDTIMSRNNLALAYTAAKDLKQAIPLYEHALADLERRFGPHHPDAFGYRTNLARAHSMQGDVNRGIQLGEQALAESIELLGPDHPHTLAVQATLATAYTAARNPQRALPLHEKTLATAKRVLGRRHPQTLEYRWNLKVARMLR